ncbi:lipopolysaccharide transport periplasmic protein LptA [Thiococcus pfennigii]|jgi:lipopolysaccharide export system protein LptA|uniref:lipopolysaccharide transport periplasmic protein LptA n=1 Tax=Thiococcus pfennigii TaxID=1057 RepID=UPI0019083601|nr:lipopolysaccharide transport periplasmic protein LptA [Thiococcus pfennigii]MBK1701591.1 lipopolysaccharide transport periplasmic protein LptA [Thiococcus pfennigii]MBK1731577.1 lipopolysaccharide transport periplasmic protein LptA [Thiococcus pfennigii]
MARLPTPHPHRTPRLIAALLLALAAAAPAAEPPADQDQPIQIEADSVELDEQQSTSLYLGNVIVVQGGMRIEADRVLVAHDATRRPEHVTAWGEPVRYRQRPTGDAQEHRANALRMEYDVAKDEITLIGRAELIQGDDRFSSDRIVYDRSQAQVKAGASAAGSGRVRITIIPDAK